MRGAGDDRSPARLLRPSQNKTATAIEALSRITVLYRIEAEIRGLSAAAPIAPSPRPQRLHRIGSSHVPHCRKSGVGLSDLTGPLLLHLICGLSDNVWYGGVAAQPGR